MLGSLDRRNPVPVLIEPRSPFWWLRWVPAVVLTVLLLQLFYVAGRVAIVPVLASFALAYLLNPLVERFERTPTSLPRRRSTSLSICSTATAPI
jgi:predicted PurR-regulated permease PerM